jgi:hypothetical protein
MKIVAPPQGAPSPVSAVIGVGERSLQTTRKVAAVRTRLADRGLSKADADLAGLARAVGQTSLSSWLDVPVPLRVLYHAREFVRLLPISAPIPTPTVTWSGANARHLIVTVSEDGMLVYSGRLGPRRRISGAEPLSGELPAPIRQSLNDVIG